MQPPAGAAQPYEEWAAEKIGKLVPLNRWQTPEDVAAMAAGEDAADQVWTRIESHMQASDRTFPMSFDAGNAAAPALPGVALWRATPAAVHSRRSSAYPACCWSPSPQTT